MGRRKQGKGGRLWACGRPDPGGALALVLALGAFGCATTSSELATPQATVRRFATALNEQRFEDAYALMSRAYRDRVSYEEFERQLNEDRRQTMEISHSLSRAPARAEQEATLRYGDQERLRMRREGDLWLLLDNPIAVYDQSTPRAALKAFVRAMEQRRYDIVMRLVPSAEKEGVTIERMEQAWSGENREEVERMLSALRSHLEEPIEIVGSHATMPYGDRMRVEFVREDGVWKIEDPE